MITVQTTGNGISKRRTPALAVLGLAFESALVGYPGLIQTPWLRVVMIPFLFPNPVPQSPSPVSSLQSRRPGRVVSDRGPASVTSRRPSRSGLVPRTSHEGESLECFFLAYEHTCNASEIDDCGQCLQCLTVHFIPQAFQNPAGFETLHVRHQLSKTSVLFPVRAVDAASRRTPFPPPHF